MIRRVETIEQLLWYVILLGFFLIIGNLFRNRLLGEYRYLAIFSAVQIVQNLFLLWMYSAHRDLYHLAYAFTSPPVWLTYILVVLELYNIALQKYEGIAKLSRKVFHVFLGIAIVTSLVTLLPEVHPSFKTMENLVELSRVERGIVSSLVFFLLMITGFLLWFPVKLTRNAVAHTGFCVVFFLTIAAGLFFRDSTGTDATRLVSTISLGMAALCLPAWAFALSAAGETIAVTSRQSLAPDQERVLRQQLDGFNDALLRSSRK
ncbi:MAG: hypothetical protein ABI693_32355 [Bryobacteraceae bacterium]